MRASLIFAAALFTSAWALPAAADLTVFEAPQVADFKLDLYGWAQPRFTWQQQDTRPAVDFEPNPAFTLIRARMGTVATLGPWARVQFESDFSSEGVTPLDAFVVLTPVHERVATLNLTAGQFRVPFSRQNLLPSVGYQIPDVAYFVAPSFIVDRDLGAMLWSDLLEGRIRLSAGVFNGNSPAIGAKVKLDPDFLYAARLELSPFGPAPRFEGDLRPLSEQHKLVVTAAVSAMRHEADELHFMRNYVGADLAATTYYYRVGGGAGDAGSGSEQWSPVLTFTTTPAAGAATPVTIGITGDSRGEQNNAWQLLQHQMHLLGPTMMLFSGDVINLATDQGEWEEWLDKAELDADGKTYLTLGQTLTMAAHGNHDNHTALFFGNLTMPQDVKSFPQYGELFYSMDVGPVHVVVTDDSWIADPSGDSAYQGILQTWLDADLTAANANRTNVPWVITVNHRSPYSSSLHGMDADVLLARQFYAPIFQKYHVDMAFSGHDHDYERSKPLDIGADANNPTTVADGQGPVFVVCAGSGADAYSAGTSSFTAMSKDFVAGGPIGLYSVLKADAHNLALTAHALMADGSDPPPFDTYTITK